MLSDRLIERSTRPQGIVPPADGTAPTPERVFAGLVLAEQLRADSAVMAADTVLLTIPNQLGVDDNAHVLESFATHVAPALGWKPNTEGPVEGYATD